MGLQEQIAEAIVIAFDELGGDPQGAADAAVEHDTVESWLQQETAKIALAGGAEMMIPGLHALTIPAGISYLIHKMAHISWGVGVIKGCYIVETPQHSDLRNILTLWANASYYNAHLLDHMAISLDTFEHALTDEGHQALMNVTSEPDDRVHVVMNTLYLMQKLVNDFGRDERAQYLVQRIGGYERGLEMVGNARSREEIPLSSAFDQPMSRRISTKLALRMATRISARVPARFVMGFIPIAGAIVNAFFNAQTLRSMADSAEKYYSHTLREPALQGK